MSKIRKPAGGKAGIGTQAARLLSLCFHPRILEHFQPAGKGMTQGLAFLPVWNTLPHSVPSEILLHVSVYMFPPQRDLPVHLAKDSLPCLYSLMHSVFLLC